MTTKDTVKIYARRFELLCIAIMFFVLTIPIIIWFFGDKLMDSSYGVILGNFSLTQRFIFFFTDYISSMLSIYALHLCIKIARIFQQGKAFTPDATTLFARLRKVTMCIGFYNILWYLGFDLCLSHRPVPLILFFIGATGLQYMFTFVFLSMFATLLFKASELQQDQDLTV